MYLLSSELNFLLDSATLPVQKGLSFLGLMHVSRHDAVASRDG